MPVFTLMPVLIANRVAPRQKRREKILLDRWSKIYGRFNEVLSGIVTVRNFAMEDPAILILDEATSVLDAETEFQVQEALERLIHGRTTFVIAHRPATVINADRILALKRGRIIESASNRELMAQNGCYASEHSRTSSAVPPCSLG